MARLVIVASHGGDTRNIWRIYRSERGVVEWSGRFPRYHHTMRDGERPHFTAFDGLANAPVDPLIVASANNPKHQPMGWPTDWSQIDDIQFTSGIGFTYPDQFDGFEEKPASRRWRPIEVPLAEDQGVQASHFLARPTVASRRYIAGLCEVSGTVEVHIVSDWEPWSVIHVQVTEPGAVQRHPKSA
jgi:hypothetical protein